MIVDISFSTPFPFSPRPGAPSTPHYLDGLKIRSASLVISPHVDPFVLEPIPFGGQVATKEESESTSSAFLADLKPAEGLLPCSRLFGSSGPGIPKCKLSG